MKLLHSVTSPAQKSGMNILVEAKKTEGLLSNTQFGRGFLHYDGLDMERDFSAAYAAYAIGNAGMKHVLARVVYGDNVQVRAGAFSMDSSDANFDALFCKEGTAILGTSRLRRKGTKIVASIPCGRMTFGSLFYPDTAWFAGGALPKTQQNVQAIVQRIQGSKFRNLLTRDRTLDVGIATSEMLRVTPEEDYAERTVRRQNPGYPRLFEQTFPKVRFLRAALEELVSGEVRGRGIGTAYGTQIPFNEVSVEHPGFTGNVSVACDVLQLMLQHPIFAFIECEFDEEFLSILTGEEEQPPLSLIGNWLSGTLEFQLDPNGEEREDDTIGDVSRVSSLGRSKAESEASATLPYDPAAMREGQENDSRLCIDNTGTFYWLPKTDNVDQYEQELETTFTNEKGEWSIGDVTNPRNVIRFDDGNGNIRQMPRKIQADRIVYTDFKVGLLCYTDKAGTLKTFDIGSFRGVTATHLRELLELSLLQENYDNEDFLGVLNSAIRQSLQMGTVPDPHTTHPIIRMDDVTRAVYRGRFQDFVQGRSSADILDFMADLADVYSRLPGMTQDFLDELRDLRFHHISPNSPLPELRVIYKMLERYTTALVENFDHHATQHRLIPTLERIGLLTALCNESPHYNRIVAQDREARGVYTDPAEDYRTVEIPEIPFTKGVKLMPHQVKIFAKLKRFPKRFTLDVSAGGGKTFTAVLVCAMYMKHAGIRKPIVICPDILLKNYFQDATYATAGAMNIIAVNTDVLKRWGPERLAELIRQAPINTVVVASFDSMGRGRERIYATRQVKVNPVTEFLQQFDFDMAVVDESHRIKNMSSNTNRNVARLEARAKVSGIMTGTLIFNGTADVVGQFNVMDPTIFGSPSHFDNKFMEADGGVKRGKADSPRLVKQRIAAQTAYVQVTRKEWAALLPPRIDEFSGEATEVFHILNQPESDIQMTQAQRDYYDQMLREIREKILEDAETDAGLRRLLQTLEGRNQRGDGEAENDEDDEKLLDDIMTRLNPYLARLEIFLANPANSREKEFTSRWSVTDRQSPKAKKVVQIVRQHIERGYVGKILVFTQYNESAEGIYEALPAELKQLAVHYTAANKASLSQFETDASKVILVGNERSIGTGLNLQMASRIIRTESTWNWGALEQAESRVNRPVPKTDEIRKAIYLDWIVVNGTIDVTKVSRMISKAVESYKFVNAGNPLFDDMPALEAVKMSLENILLRNDVNDPEHGVMTHFEMLGLCRSYEEQEFQAFRNDPNVRKEPYELNGGLLPGSALLKNVPYVPGMALYNPEALGLVPMIQYITDTRKSTLNLFNPVDLVIHTEDGDGRCTGFRRNSKGEIGSVTVQLPDGSKSTYELSSVFVVTRANVDIDTRRQIAEQVMTRHTGRPVQIQPDRQVQIPKPTKTPVPAPVVEDENTGVPNKGKIKLLRNKPVPNADKVSNAEYNMYVLSIGHMYCLTTTSEDPDTPIDTLVEHDFLQVKPYYYAQFKNPGQLEAWYTAARKVSGFNKESAKQIEEMIELMKAHKPDAFFQNVTPAALRDFWRNQKTAPRAGVVMPFVSIEDNGEGKRPTIYVVAFKHQNPQFRIITSRARVPGVVWETTEDDQYWYLAPNQKALLKKMGEVNAEAPIKNFNKLALKIKTLRPTPSR